MVLSLTESIIEFLELHYFPNCSDQFCDFVSSNQTVPHDRSAHPLYPNPSQEGFQITGNLEGVEILVYNMLGVLAYKDTTTRGVVNLSASPPGHYLVRLQVEGTVLSTLKYVKI